MINYKKDTDKIVTLTLNMAGRNINIINHEIGKAFIPVVKHLKAEKAKGELKGVIITSGKKTFLAGGDLDYLMSAKDAEEIYNFSQKLESFFKDLESPGVPVVAAINGTALGTGFEMALACHHRIVIDDPKIRLGHPEVTLGLMPGSGGVIRLLWGLGLEQAYHVLTDGRRYTPNEALKVGIVDDIAKDEHEMLEKAKIWLMKTNEGRRPWHSEGGTIPHGTARDKNIAQIIRKIAAELMHYTHNNYPAKQAILNTLVEGSKVDFDTATKIQSRNFTNLVLGKEFRNMAKAFWFDFNEIKSGGNRPKGYGKFRPKKIGIIGAGTMGSGIALVSVMRGLEVIIKDISKPVADRGKSYVEKKLREYIDRGRVSETEKKMMLDKITTTENSKSFEDCDLVIEAVFENELVKSKVTQEAEEHMDEYSLFGTNTLSIPVSKLAKASNRPENYVGLHFFPPVDEVPLVEIVQGEKTSDETIARAFDFVKQIRKIPIIVKDNWGFYAARVQNTFILEGITLLQEGYTPALIDNIGIQAGMPKGALELADELSLEIILKYEQQAAEHYGAKYIQHPAVKVLDKMINEYKRTGKKRKAGFYSYDENGNKQLWEELTEHFPTTQCNYSREEVIERMLFAQVLEAVWCYQEKIIRSVAEGNLGSIHGWGFPPYKGGAFQYINDYGVDTFIEKCQMYEKAHGQRFSVPKILLKKKGTGELIE